MITNFEKLVIDRAVENALCFGLGILTSARERIEDVEGEWRDELEKYVFETYVEGHATGLATHL